MLKWILLLALLGVFAAGSWALVDTVIHRTGDHEFCTSCHSIEPMGAAYLEDLHGGNNRAGWRATCSDCHIPKDNALHYLYVKGMHGVVDPIMELVKDPSDIDWHGNRERREEYVYDSACLDCHEYLAKATEGNRMANRAHTRYFDDPEKRQCVSCHENVGHARLEYHLEQMGWPAPASETAP